MRVLTKEQYDEIRNSKVYRMIMNEPPPDHTVLNRDAEAFAKWIARIHKKERDCSPRGGIAAMNNARAIV